MLIAYLDESGTHDGSPALAVAGVLGESDDWTRFESSWRWFLNKYAIPTFHMASFESRLPPFADWSDVRRFRCIRQAHRSLVFHASAGIASAVILADYTKVVSQGLFEKKVGSPYCLAINQCLAQAINWSRTQARGRPVAFVLEGGAAGRGEVEAMFDEAKTHPSWGPFIATLEFRGKECLPLQAADIVAYEVWKQMANQRVAGPLRGVRNSLHNILSGLRFEDHYFNEENLLALVGQIAEKDSLQGPGAFENN